MTLLESIHCAATWALVGLIWTVQMVQYPLFETVGREAFRAYHKRHTRQITWVVAPLMLMELGTGLAWAAEATRNPWVLASLAPLAFNWLSTWRVQIPLHESLSNGFDPEAHRKLVSSNWWRTLAWTLRGVFLLLALD